MPSRVLPLLAALALVPLLACDCGDDRRPPTRDAGPGGDAGPCAEGALGCRGREVTTCTGGVPVPTDTCPPDLVCVPELGCRACSPGGRFCAGSEIRICNATGDGSTVEMECGLGEACRSGVCLNACDAARDDLSNVGCEYYAVDLDNEYSSLNDAASEQFAIVLANPSDVTVAVLVERNDGGFGSGAVPGLVGSYSIPPNDLLRIDLPKREVDGSGPMARAGVGTFLSPNAYRVTTNYPVVAYQFNPIIQSFSNDASLLIPVTGLDSHYRILGWPTANPIAIPGLPVPEGIPDHSFVTVVGTQVGTAVRVTLGGPIVGGAGIAPTPAGGTVEVTLGPFEVLNLESDGIPGDLTGTVVEATAPVAVFSGGERGIAPIDFDRIPLPPSGPPDDVCCTEHLEEQVFPTVAWGTDFVMTRSPIRSDTGWVEPDIYRIMADKDATTITTNLPAPDDRITLNANQWHEFYSQRSFILRADKPVSIEQILVSQGFLPSWAPGHGGDPSMLLFPPYQQYRDAYIFLVPETFSSNYVVVGMPVGTVVLLDERDINGDEFMALCTYEDAGDLDGTLYQAVTCPVSGGTHRIRSSLPVGIMVYGYYSVGSYGYAGGANLTRINFI